MALFDNGTDYEFFIQSKFANVPRSRFDLSRLNSLTFDVGELRVVDWFETLPGDDFEISCQWLLESLPLAVRPMNRFTIMIDYYYIEKRKLWKGFKTYITKGRDGNIDLELPRIALYRGVKESADDSAVHLYDTCESLSQDLGIPSYTYASPKHYNQSRTVDSESFVLTGRSKVNYACALPFMFYQSIFKYYYLNQNLTQSNPHWFPKYGDDYWILPENYGRHLSLPNADEFYPADFGLFFADNSCDNETETNSSSFFANFFSSPVPTSTSQNYGTVSKPADAVSLLQLRYSQFRSDAFTTSLPWLMRGDVPSMTTGDVSFELNNPRFWVPNSMLDEPSAQSLELYGSNASSASMRLYHLGSSGGSVGHQYPSNLPQTVSKLTGSTNLLLELDANKLRSMLAMTAWQERNGYTNGSYNKMIESHFRENPNAESYAPIHIGGVASDIYFSDVLQTTPTADSPAGTQVSNAQSSSSGNIGRFHSKDYGYIMAIMRVIPDTMYVDGLPHEFIKSKMQDEYFPEFASLSPQAVRNDEIFVSDDENVNKGLFGYQDRYWYLKTRSNRVGGMFSLPPSSDVLFSAYSQARVFSSLPKLSNQFVTASPDNLRRDMFAYMNEPAFKFQFASRVSATRPLPYKSIPNTFGF